jgi:hypothetical protein
MKGDEAGVVPELDLPAAACKRWWDEHALIMRVEEAVSPTVIAQSESPAPSNFTP